MPALRLYGRRALVAGDDLQLPALSALLVRVFQSFVLVPPILAHLILEARRCAEGDGVDDSDGEEGTSTDTLAESDEGGYCDAPEDYFLTDPAIPPNDNEAATSAAEDACRTSHLFPLLLLCYVSATLLYSLISAVVEIRLCRASSVGTPTEPQLRYPTVKKIVERKMVWLALANFIVCVVGLTAVMGYSGRYYGCVEAIRRLNDGGDGGGGGYGIDDTDYESAGDIGADDLDAEGGVDVRSFYEGRRLHEEAAVAISTDTADVQEGWWLSSYEDATDPDAWVSSLYYTSQAVPNLLGPTAWWYALLLLLLSQLAECIVSALSLIRVCRLPKDDELDLIPTIDESDDDGAILASFQAHHHRRSHGTRHEMVEQMWRDTCESSCRFLAVSTCFLFGGRNLSSASDFYGNIAEVLADYFEDGGNLDVVPSDIVAGLVMLGRVQGERAARARREVLQASSASRARGEDNAADALLGSPERSLNARARGRYPSSGSLDRCDCDGGAREEERDDDAKRSAVRGRLDVPPPAEEDGFHSTVAEDVFHSARETELEFRTSVVPRSGVAAAEGAGGVSAEGEGDERGPDGRIRYETEAAPRPVLSRDDESDRAVVAEGARFARHALAIYTWMLYVYTHPATGLCRLGCGTPACTCCRSKRRARRGIVDETHCDGDEEEAVYDGDNLCHAHRTALLLHSGLEACDVSYGTFNSGFHETPYCITVDHRWSTVVISIRGTLSLEDCVVDVLVDPESLDELAEDFGVEEARGQHCHGGVLVCTRWIYRDLQRHGILDRLLFGPSARYPNYRLRIVGHSLGAACAVMLSFMLRPRFPDLRALSYSPPGGFLSRALADGCQDFVTSFVLDSDMVPRLSVDNMEQLRDETLDLIGRIKVNKVEVAHRFLAGGVSGLIRAGCCSGRVGDGDGDGDLDDLVRGNADLLHSRGGADPDTDFARRLGRFRDVQCSRKRRRAKPRVPLFPPGRMVHLIKTSERTSCRHGLLRCLTCGASNAGSEYTPVFAENDDFNEIVISPTCWTDHFPDRVCVELEGVARAFGLDTSLGSSASDRGRARQSLSSDQDVSEVA